MLIGPALAKNIPDMFSSDQDANSQKISHFIIAIDAAKLSVDGENSRSVDFADFVIETGGRLPGSNRANPENLNSSEDIVITDQVAEQLKQWSNKLGI